MGSLFILFSFTVFQLRNVMIYYFQNATPSSRESMKIEEQKLDLYIERIIEAAASSLKDVVVRVSSSTKQSEKEFGNSSASS